MTELPEGWRTLDAEIVCSQCGAANHMTAAVKGDQTDASIATRYLGEMLVRCDVCGERLRPEDVVGDSPKEPGD